MDGQEQEGEAGLLARARTVADELVEAEGARIAATLDSGNVTAIEQVFLRLFQDIYLRGYADGRAGALA